MRDGPRKTGAVVLAAFLAGFAGALPGCASASIGEQESGVKGQVLMGPVVPGPVIEEEPPEKPFSAIFHVLDAEDNEVGQFESDEEGKFQILLPPGNYTIVPDKTAPIMAAVRQRKPVNVPQGEVVEVKLRFDTGLR